QQSRANAPEDIGNRRYGEEKAGVEIAEAEVGAVAAR
ncbi:unnamed protein product, partial [marine sediment metagenome]